MAGAGRAARPAHDAAAAERPFVDRRRQRLGRGACEALQRFAESWQLPVGCAFRFQDLFDNRHRTYAGDVGIGINPKLGRAHQRADLSRGRRAAGRDDDRRLHAAAGAAAAQKLVHIHAGAEELGRVYAAQLMLQSSMANAAKALETLAAPNALPWGDWTQAAHADYEANMESMPVEPLDMAEVIKTIQRLAPPDSVLTNGAGNYSGWLHRYYRYQALQHGGRTQLAPTAGSMGYGVPAAVAAALLYPDRTVINIAGDGDFLMTGQELATATGYGAGSGAAANGRGRLISIVVDNATYGTIRMHQEREYPGRVSGSDLFNPDFAALARAYGWRAEKVEATAGFEAAFRTALETAAADLAAPSARRGGDHESHDDLGDPRFGRGAQGQALGDRWRRRSCEQRGRCASGPHDLEQTVHAAFDDRHHRTRAHRRLRVVRDRQADRAPSSAGRSRRRRRRSPVPGRLQIARRSRGRRGVSRHRRRCRPTADRPCARSAGHRRSRARSSACRRCAGDRGCGR
jgi:hypothetical protein